MSGWLLQYVTFALMRFHSVEKNVLNMFLKWRCDLLLTLGPTLSASSTLRILNRKNEAQEAKAQRSGSDKSARERTQRAR